MIHVYLAPGSRAKKALDDVIPGHVQGQVSQELPLWREVPGRADFVVHAGSGAETMQQRMFAANRGAMLVHLPEAYEWLQRRIVDAAAEGEDLTILDAGLLSMKVAA